MAYLSGSKAARDRIHPLENAPLASGKRLE
jgi:hypothetical protein